MEEEVKVRRWRCDQSSRGRGAMGFQCTSPELEEWSIAGSSLEGDEVGVGPGVNQSQTGGHVRGCVGAKGRVGSQQTTGGDRTRSKPESDRRLLLEVVLEPEVSSQQTTGGGGGRGSGVPE